MGWNSPNAVQKKQVNMPNSPTTSVVPSEKDGELHNVGQMSFEVHVKLRLYVFKGLLLHC